MNASERLDATFAALADPTRRAILARLALGDASVNELARPFEMSQPAISKHLRIVLNARLVREWKVGRERLYQIDPMPLQRVAGWIEGYRAFWSMNLDRLKAHVERK